MKSFKQHQDFLKEEDLLLEGDATATAFEGYITVAYNGGLGSTHAITGKPLSKAQKEANETALSDIKKKKSDYNKYNKAATSIAKELYSSFGGGLMTHEGKLSGSLSSKWRGSDKTSKADNSVGSNYRISLKAGAKAQFMSSHTEEAISIFEAAIEYMKDDKVVGDVSNIIKKVESALTIQVDKEFKIGNLLDPINARKDELKSALDAKIKKEIDKRNKQKKDDKRKKIKGKKYESNKQIKTRLEKQATEYSLRGKGKVSTKAFGGVTGKVFGAGGSGGKSISAKAMEKVYFNQTKFQEDLSQDLTVFFNNNKEFKEYFVFEAASGVKKFTDTKPKANWVLVFDTNGSVLNLEKIATSKNRPTGWMKGKSTSANFRCNWKNHGMSSTRGTYPSIRAEFDQDKINARLKDAAAAGKIKLPEYREHLTMSELISEEFESFTSENRVLIEEAIQDQGLINEGLLSWGKSKVKKLYNQIKSFLSGMITKITESIKTLAKKGMDYVLYFLGVELSSVKVTGLSW